MNTPGTGRIGGIMKEKQSKRQNIVFFFSDQQRADTLGCNGQPLPVTPRLDQFAREDAVNFSNTFTPQPVCGPARSMLQTGLYPTQTGCYRNAVSLPLDRKTLARYLSEAGYKVGYVGKWHLASDQDENHYEALPVPLERRGGYEDYWMAADVLEFTSHGYGGYVFDKDGNELEFTGYRTDCLTDHAIRYIDGYDSDQPFFLMISHIEPHHQNDRGDYEGPKGSREQFGAFVPPADLEPGKGDWEQFYPDYLGCCHALDENFGRVIDALKRKGIYDQTMVIYSSDHGCHFRTHADEVVEHGQDDYKRNSFEGTIHIPMVVKGEGFEPGREQTRVVSLLDLPKTILTAAGLDTEKLNLQGRPLQEAGAPDWEEAVYIQISESFVGRALRTGRYKYVVYDPKANPWTESGSPAYREKYLFDLEKDPLEKHNLIHDPGSAKVKELLREQLIRLGKKAGEVVVVEG